MTHEQQHVNGPLTGQCNHCNWYVIESSYAKLATAYQDHLREEHPQAWLRA
ncbi:hypothetical protein ACNS7O_13185 [Haloferacaceae archaeon DSL9]